MRRGEQALTCYLGGCDKLNGPLLTNGVSGQAVGNERGERVLQHEQ